MTNNKLEKMFSKSLHSSHLFGMKLHNNPLAHQNTPADYLISNGKEVILVECKQVTCKDGNGRLAINRLKQLHDLLSFAKHYTNHKAFFCIAFWDGRWDKSEIYFIPAKGLKIVIDNWEKKSFNRFDMQTIFYELQVRIEVGGVLWLENLM